MADRIQAITMPKWGIEMTEGTITTWHVGVGAHVSKGDPLFDVETDKIVNTVESPTAGVLRQILATEGELRAVGALVAVCTEDSVLDSDVQRFIAEFKSEVVSFEPDATVVSTATPAAGSSAHVTAETEVRISPVARRTAERLGIDVSKVTGTGRNGRISVEDIEAYVAASAPAAAGAGNTPKRVAMSASRVTIARRLLASSQSIPAYRLTCEVDMSALLARKQQSGGEHVTVTDLLVHAVARSLLEHPMVNAQLDGNDILQFPHADVSLAVATDNGLLTPIIRNADQKSLAEIARESRELAKRARAGSLKREELDGGTFTISNLGMFAISSFDAIINPPQAAILAVGATVDRPALRAGVWTAVPTCVLTLTADHRVVDGAVGARFLTTLRARIEEPAAD